MPRQQRALDTRRKVLLGAAEAIDRYGYAAATISDIVAESHMTKGAVYFHFSSKEAIAQAIISEQSNWLEAYAHDGPAVQAIVELSYRFAEALQYDPLMRASIRMTVDRAGPATSIEQGYTSWIAAITRLLEQARGDGVLQDSVDPASCAFILASAMTGMQLTSEALTRRQDLTARIESFWVLLLPSILRPDYVATVDTRPPTPESRAPVTD